MIQYYKDLIATVTYDEKSLWIKNNNIINDHFEIDYGVNDIKIRDKYSFGTQEEYFYRKQYDELKPEWKFYENFNILSKALNKPIDHIVREMKGVQQPDNIDRLKAITNERISDISIEQWEKWCLKYGLTYQENKLGCPVVINNTQAHRSIAIGTQCRDGIRANFDYNNFLRLLELKENRYIDHHDYMNNVKEIYKLVNELEGM